ncbi:hypothetical protein [Rhabdochromatium marinum]|uniref:hypothetical protein n=1 Tax=Rhabdochromatium marinum TaxID=48729 RepID=UPI00190349F8|nr:hypothetical protein [Rhabdochromatium marinum]
MNDMKVAAPVGVAYYYPDVVLNCGWPIFIKMSALLTCQTQQRLSPEPNGD